MKFICKLFYFLYKFCMFRSSLKSIAHRNKKLVIKIGHFICHHIFCPKINSHGRFFNTIPKSKEHCFCILRRIRGAAGSIPANVLRNFFRVQLDLNINI